MHDTATCQICQSQPKDGEFTDETLHAFIDACRDELIEKQNAFMQTLPPNTPWNCDLENNILKFGDRTFDITPIGTHSDEQQVWFWVWADTNFPDAARKCSESLKALYDITGFEGFSHDGMNATRLEAQDLAACAIHFVGAQGLYRCDGDVILFLAVH